METHKKLTLDELSPHPVMLAPMVGLTHYAVRRGVQHFLPEGAKVLWPTEMLNSRRIPSQHPNDTPEVNFEDRDWGLCPQLLANEEEFIRRSVPKLEAWGAKAIDINMGCPVLKALKHNYGVALMGDPVYAREVVRMTVKNATVPVSVKLRAGLEGQDFQYLVDFVAGLFEAGASWITMHPRTAGQMRKGVPDWKLIKRVKDHFKAQGINIPIIGNGDVQCHEDIAQLFEEAECDRVMIGRAAIVKPWLIRNEPEPDPYTQGELYGQFLMKVLEASREFYELEAGKKRIKFLVVYGKPYVEYGEYLYGRVMAALTYEDLEAAFMKFFSQKQKIIKRTQLRH
ncbi:MAG: tRNA-dihydrouridine synthase family protein [Bdellovibrionales bacterium]|nr:tRNA-dihydrouridine synthase family protein [Oligoflexia bacterium]